MPPLLKRIVIIVLALHGLTILLSIFSPFSKIKSAQKKIGQKVVVQTVALNTSKPENSVAISDRSETVKQPSMELPSESIAPSEVFVPEPEVIKEIIQSPPKQNIIKSTPTPAPEIKPKQAPPKPAPKIEIKPKPKPLQPKPLPKPAAKPVAQKPTPTPSAVNNSTAPPKKNEKLDKLLAQARDSIGKVQKASASTPTSTPKKPLKAQIDTPDLIGELQSDSFSLLGSSGSGNSEEAVYGSELINRLKLLLHLHEHGDVDVELTLAKSGKVISMKIIRDENRNNRLYIEKTLPSLSLPPFGSYFEGEAQRTFVIRLTSQKG
jgi:hypothetical protein